MKSKASLLSRARNRMVRCDGCGIRVKGKNMNSHQQTTCREKGTFRQRELQKQLDAVAALRAQDESAAQLRRQKAAEAARQTRLKTPAETRRPPERRSFFLW